MSTAVEKLEAIKHLLRKTCGNCYWFHRVGCSSRLQQSRRIWGDTKLLRETRQKYWLDAENHVCDGWKLRTTDESVHNLEERLRGILEGAT